MPRGVTKRGCGAIGWALACGLLAAAGMGPLTPWLSAGTDGAWTAATAAGR